MRHINAVVLYGMDGTYTAALAVVSQQGMELIEPASPEALRRLSADFLNISDELDKLNKTEANA